MTCLECENDYLFNNKTNNCEMLILVNPGCSEYSYYGSCVRCELNYYMTIDYKCNPVQKKIANCNLYDSVQNCSLCKESFTLSFDRKR